MYWSVVLEIALEHPNPDSSELVRSAVEAAMAPYGTWSFVGEGRLAVHVGPTRDPDQAAEYVASRLNRCLGDTGVAGTRARINSIERLT